MAKKGPQPDKKGYVGERGNCMDERGLVWITPSVSRALGLFFPTAHLRLDFFFSECGWLRARFSCGCGVCHCFLLTWSCLLIVSVVSILTFHGLSSHGFSMVCCRIRLSRQ